MKILALNRLTEISGVAKAGKLLGLQINSISHYTYPGVVGTIQTSGQSTWICRNIWKGAKPFTLYNVRPYAKWLSCPLERKCLPRKAFFLIIREVYTTG